MRKISCVCILSTICLFYGILFPHALAGDNEEAGELFSSAVSLIDEAKVESEDYSNALAEIGAGYHIAGLQPKEEDKAVLRELVLKAYPMESFWKTEGHKSVFRDLGFLISHSH